MWSISEFRNARLSLFMSHTVPFIGLPLLFSNLTSGFDVSYPDVLSKTVFFRSFFLQGQFNRFIPLALGAFIFYELRGIERQLGTVKYAYLFFLSSLASCVVSPLALVLVGKVFGASSIFAFSSLPHGPIAPIFAALTYLYLDFPPILRLSFSDMISIAHKHLLLIAAAVLCGFLGIFSTLPAVFSGIVVAFLFRRLKIQPPARFTGFVSQFVMKETQQAKTRSRANPRDRRVPPARSTEAPVRQRLVGDAPSRQISEAEMQAAVETLTSMGYSPQAVREALTKSNGDINRAANQLVTRL